MCLISGVSEGAQGEEMPEILPFAGTPRLAPQMPDGEMEDIRRGTGLSECGSIPGEPEPYLHDAQAVVDGFGLVDFDVLGTLLGTTEAAWVASRPTW